MYTEFDCAALLHCSYVIIVIGSLSTNLQGVNLPFDPFSVQKN